MTFLNRFKFSALAVILLVTAMASCEKDPTTIGAGVIGGTPFTTGKKVFDVFAYNKDIEAVRTNKLPIYQLGAFDHPAYGKTEAMVNSQVLLSSPNPTFGAYSQEVEDNPSDGIPAQIPENESVDSVYLYIPFFTNPTGDSDLDGLADEFDADPLDPNSDSDNDGLTDSQENSNGTDPLDPDTDGDGIGDAADEDFTQNQFVKSFDLDSIYKNGKLYDNMGNAMFNLKIERSNFFLRDLDPDTNFQEAQEYYSSQQFVPTFVDSLLFDGEVSISAEQIPVRRRDDPSTEDENEAEQFNYLGPGIRVALDKDFFQNNIIDKEGSFELMNQANFSDFLRGIHFSLASVTDEFMVLFNLTAANIVISYNYDSFDTSDGSTSKKQSDFVLNFISQSQTNGVVTGNAVNTFINEAYPQEIENSMDTGENASRIYVKGGSGSYAEIKLFDEINGMEIINQIKANNWIINEANLVFYVADNSDVAEPPRLYLYNAETGGPVFSFPRSLSEQAITFFDYDGNLVKSDDGKGIKYTVKITEHINNLVIRDAENSTLGLTVTASLFQPGVSNAMLSNGKEEDIPVAATITPLGTALFGSDVSAENSDKKLKLEIFYTEAN